MSDIKKIHFDNCSVNVYQIGITYIHANVDENDFTFDELKSFGRLPPNHWNAYITLRPDVKAFIYWK